MNTKNVEAKQSALVFKTNTNLKEVGSVAMQHLPKMYETLGKLGIGESEPSVFIYRGATGDMDKEFELEIALITNQKKELDGPYQFSEVEPIKCVSADYKGSMPNIMKKYDEIFAEIGKEGLSYTKEVREVYHKWVGEDSEENQTSAESKPWRKF